MSINTFFSHCLVSISIILASCNSQSDESTAVGSQIPAGAEVIPYEGTTGLVRAVERLDGTTLSEGDLLNGLRHGSWTEYGTTGLPERTTTYVNGKKQGSEFTFDSRGNVQTKAYYHNDQLHGEYLVFKNRNIVEKRNYENGLLEGPLIKYYSNGKLLQESGYANDQLDGIAKWYDQEGNLTIAYRYEDGILVDKDPELEE